MEEIFAIRVFFSHTHIYTYIYIYIRTYINTYIPTSRAYVSVLFAPSGQFNAPLSTTTTDFSSLLLLSSLSPSMPFRTRHCPRRCAVYVVSVVVRELGTRRNKSVGKDAHPMLTIHRPRMRMAIGIVAVIRKLELVALHRRINHPFVVQVEKETAVEAIVCLAATIRLNLVDNFANVLADKLIFLYILRCEDAPAIHLAATQLDTLMTLQT